jgi:hypothetical protein
MPFVMEFCSVTRSSVCESDKAGHQKGKAENRHSGIRHLSPASEHFGKAFFVIPKPVSTDARESGIQSF